MDPDSGKQTGGWSRRTGQQLRHLRGAETASVAGRGGLSSQGSSSGSHGVVCCRHWELCCHARVCFTSVALWEVDWMEQVGVERWASLEGNFGHGVYGLPHRPPGRQEYLRGC